MIAYSLAETRKARGLFQGYELSFHMAEQLNAEVIVVGGGIAGLSAGIYLGRAERETLIIDSDKSMAKWEPDVQNYLGFPEGIAGEDLVERGRQQVERYHAKIVQDEVVAAEKEGSVFILTGKERTYQAKCLLIATGIYHLPPEIDGVTECLGHSMFFCKDCDGFRVRGKQIAIYGWTNETVQYALGMLFYSSTVFIVTDGKKVRWDKQHAEWIEEYKIPVYPKSIERVQREECQVKSLKFSDESELQIDALFTTRGDIYFNRLAKNLGAKLDEDGQIVVDLCLRTSVEGLYAAGCVTPANCQMIIAAGQGATAAQSINRDLFEESLATHALRRFRKVQLEDLKETGSPKDRKTLSETTPIKDEAKLVSEASLKDGE
ncbi:MAG: putative Thioredoxin-disulfide reductase [Pedosphaera sp.]|nr:putative Thioredoxin-disulfide reductase [Pedosphaera sp.]